MSKVVTFGEIMLRLSTEKYLRFSQSKNFSATYGGGEFNVAVSLANYGIDAEFVTRLPENEIGECALKEMRKMKVNTNNVIFGGDRLGIYFLETGSGNRGSNVVYDLQTAPSHRLKKVLLIGKKSLKVKRGFTLAESRQPFQKTQRKNV